MNNIRNFCIIAHIDHGKSTLQTGYLRRQIQLPKEYQAQVLDDMDLERERGITIKSHAIQMEYFHDSKKFILNLIDTPGMSISLMKYHVQLRPVKVRYW